MFSMEDARQDTQQDGFTFLFINRTRYTHQISTFGTIMANSAIIHKVSLTIADMERHYYQQHELVMAMHPSETELRFLVKVIAFALNAHDQLVFTKGLATDDEPEAWHKSLSDDIKLWIDFGQVDEKRIRKACGRAERVIIYTYQERKANMWWEKNKHTLERHNNLEIYHLSVGNAETLVSRNMQLQCNIDEGAISLSNDENHESISITPYVS